MFLVQLVRYLELKLVHFRFSFLSVKSAKICKSYEITLISYYTLLLTNFVDNKSRRLKKVSSVHMTYRIHARSGKRPSLMGVI